MSYIPAGPAPITQYWIGWLLAEAVEMAHRESKATRSTELLSIALK